MTPYVLYPDGRAEIVLQDGTKLLLWPNRAATCACCGSVIYTHRCERIEAKDE